VTRWIAKSGQPIERRDILRYALVGAVFLGLDRFTEDRWERERGKLLQSDLFVDSSSPQNPPKANSHEHKQRPGYYVPS